ncbi:disulfide-isomerase a6 [Brachionus plicatilis]|uniref:Disulfide-isomerase a6 n=1 Tax=Brachionus plicatilis TaxID=10195 RepID=A0A3M7PDZ9_BRAPC|nr:disulfide-isomerase a6 [Brachionus plicatilis]
MKKKAKEYENEIEYLLKTRLDTKATKELKFSEIEDFPRLSKTIIIENIIFGTYQYNQCQKYYEDLLNNETCYLISEKSYESRNNAENTKIIAFEIASRHKRSEVKKFTKKKKLKFYKVFIKYVPLLNEWRSIKSYICNCMSGRKVVGCCVHVATVLCFLAFDRFRNIRIKGKHL